jgi:hypothetical protein
MENCIINMYFMTLILPREQVGARRESSTRREGNFDTIWPIVDTAIPGGMPQASRRAVADGA